MSFRDSQVNEFKAFPVRWRVLVQIIFVIIEPENLLAFCQKRSIINLSSTKFQCEVLLSSVFISFTAPRICLNCEPDLPLHITQLAFAFVLRTKQTPVSCFSCFLCPISCLSYLQDFKICRDNWLNGSSTRLNFLRVNYNSRFQSVRRENSLIQLH